MNYNFNFIIRCIERHKEFFDLLIFLCGTVYLQNFSLIASFKKIATLNPFLCFLRVIDILTDNEYKRFDHLDIVVFCVQFQMYLCLLMNTNSILQFQNIKFFFCKITFFKVSSACNSWILNIQTIIQSFCKVIFIDNVLESLSIFIKRSGCHFKSKDWS